MDTFKERLVLNNISLAENIAYKMFFKLSSRYTLDELKSTAYLGLIDAAEKFNVDNNKRFESFARKRIKGSILDEVRADKRYNIKIEVVYKQPIQSLDFIQAKEDYLSDLLIKNEIEEMLMCLDQREKEIVKMYYLRNLTQKEISSFFGLKQPAISKIIKKAINKIKKVA